MQAHPASEKSRQQPDTASPAGTIHRLFEDQAARAPHRRALVAGEVELSFGELNRRANRLAHHLCALGVGGDDLVPLCLERSASSLVAVLGILKAGAAYVPLDPILPAARLKGMLESLDTPFLVTATLWLERLPATPKTVCLDRDRELAAASDENPRAGVGAGNLVYGLFTSGSTGRPKAVGVEHRQLLNYVDGMVQRLEVPASFAAVSTLAADVINTAIFPTLASGGCLHLIGREPAMDPAALAEYFARHEIDYLKIVPSHLAGLLAAPQAADLLPRRGLVIGGEALTWELVDRIGELRAGLQVINSYGPTEATVAVLTHRLEPGPRLTTTVPLGRPLPNNRIEMLDANRAPVTPGASGELAIAGASLSRGYLGQPRLTAERFLPDPRSAEPGGRLYPTGDRVRRLVDGQLEFLGRIDHQVKIRGFRVELGEIEAVLAAHPEVGQAVVVPCREAPGESWLTAYVTPARTGDAAPGATIDDEVSLAALRRHARERLPDYMVPVAWRVLPAFSLTPNGKIDRRALPPVPRGRAAAGAVYAPPKSPLEEVLTGLWSQVLGVAEVGVDDDFFALGGHSLLAMQLVSRLRQVCAVDLPLASVLAATTVARLAVEVERHRLSQQGVEVPPLVAEPLRGPSVQSLAQERYWRRRHLEPVSVARNDLGALRLTGPLDVPALRRALAALVARHEVLRTSYGEAGGKAVQIVHPWVEVRLPIVDLGRIALELRQDKLWRQLAATESQRRFDLEHPPLFRLTLLRCAAEQHVLLISIHHIASDGWSFRLLEKELVAIYNALRRRRPSPLPAPPLQYRHFATWQRRCLENGQWQRQLGYWRESLRDVVPTPQLPLDRPHPPRQSFRGATEPFELGAPLPRRLRAWSAEQGATLYMTLLAAFKALLYLRRPQEEITVSSLFANRNRPQLEGVLGCFMNVLPLRTRVSGELRFEELVRRVREVTLGAYSHPDIPLETLVADLLPEHRRAVDEIFVFRVLFALQATPPLLNAESSELEIERLVIPLERMYNDLLFFLTDLGDRVHGVILYNVDIFGAPTIRRLRTDFERILEAAYRDPQRHLDDLLGEGAAATDPAIAHRGEDHEELCSP